MIEVRMTQHPVGQGGMASGTVFSPHEHLRWVYDCGSNQDDALKREIGDLARLGRHDYLFISHLDHDHVSQVDQLLQQCQIEEVILPYMSYSVLVMIVLCEGEAGRPTGMLWDLIEDPPGWFGDRGVKRITFVGGPDDDGDPPEGLRPRLPGPDLMKKKTMPKQVIGKWSPKPKKIDIGREAESDCVELEYSYGSPRDSIVQRVARDAVIWLGDGSRVFDWVLAPYAHRPDKKRMEAFRSALVNEFGPKIHLHDIRNALKSEAGRKKLRACYDKIWKNHNLVSLALYSGPAVSRGRGELVLPRKMTQKSMYPGWMFTGDADLLGTVRRDRFFEYYSELCQHVGTVMLPHHGSAHNFHEGLLRGFPNLQLAYAAAGPNQWGHPHKQVKDAVKKSRTLAFQRVSEKRKSELTKLVEIQGSD